MNTNADFLQYFDESVFQVFKDNEKAEGYAQIFESYDEAAFKDMNDKGMGIYFTPNGFKGGRTKDCLTKLNAIFADLDVAKHGMKQTQEEIDLDKAKLIKELKDWFPPNFIITTKNGIQPVWLIDYTNEIKEYQSAIKGIIEWSKQFGGLGDKVYDITRVIRMPNFNHHKSDPYMCTVETIGTSRFPLEMIRSAFPYEEEIVKPKTFIQSSDVSSPTFQAIERIDFKELVIKAFNSVGRTAEFDRQHRLILDGRLTGTFQGENGNGRFLGSSSHEPFSGNTVTVVADILACTNKEAYRWILEEFNIDMKKAKAVEKVKEIEAKSNRMRKKRKYYSWGTKNLTETFAPIKSDTYTIIGASSGTGKTTFCINMGLANAELGHNVLYLSLEMSSEEILDHLARKYAGITIKEEIYDEVPENKEQAYESKYKELQNMKNFTLKGVKGGTEINWETLKKFMEGDWDLIFIDNLNLITKDQGMSEYEHQGWISSQFLGYAADNQTPLVVIHHYSKGGQKDGSKSSYSLSGSTKIVNDAERIVLLSRPAYDVDQNPTAEDRAMLSVMLDKARSYDKARGVVYFHKGRFLDEYPCETYIKWQEA